MSIDNECPLCGKPKEDNDELCKNCRNYVDNQYTTNLFGQGEDSIGDKPDMGEETSTEKEDVLSNVLSDKDEREAKPNSPTQRKKMSKTLWFILIGCVIILLVGIIATLNMKHIRQSAENEQRFWDSCVVVNTPLSYAKYLVSFQNGKYEDEAHDRIRTLRIEEEAAWDQLKKSSDINDYYNYLSDNPNTPYVKAVREKMDSLAWITTVKDGTADAFNAYLDNVKLGNIVGLHSDEAQEKYDYLSQIKVLEGAALDSIRGQLDIFYKALSANDKNTLKDALTSNFIFFSDTLSNTAIVDLLAKESKAKKIKKIVYEPNLATIQAQRDNKGIVFVDLLVSEKSIHPAVKKKKEITTVVVDTINIIIDKDSKIKSISSKKKDKK